MSQWLFIAALTISSSLDNLGVGLSYGIRTIRIGLRSNILISVICFLFSACGIYAGMWVSTFLPGVLPIILGSFILIIIGIRLVLLGVPRQGKKPQLAQSLGEIEYPKKNSHPPNGSEHIPINPQDINTDPQDIHGCPQDIRGCPQDIHSTPTANQTKPKNIGFLESIILGMALSANALTNGIGAGLLGFSPLLISLFAAIASFITIQAGTAFGLKLSQVHIGRFSVGQFGTIISGCLMMIIAVSIFIH